MFAISAGLLGAVGSMSDSRARGLRFDTRSGQILMFPFLLAQGGELLVKVHVVTLAQKVNNSIFTTFQEKQKTIYLFGNKLNDHQHFDVSCSFLLWFKQ